MTYVLVFHIPSTQLFGCFSGILDGNGDKTPLLWSQKPCQGQPLKCYDSCFSLFCWILRCVKDVRLLPRKISNFPIFPFPSDSVLLKLEESRPYLVYDLNVNKSFIRALSTPQTVLTYLPGRLSHRPPRYWDYRSRLIRLIPINHSCFIYHRKIPELACTLITHSKSLPLAHTLLKIESTSQHPNIHPVNFYLEL